MVNCGRCFSDKERQKVWEIESKASLWPALASVNIQGGEVDGLSVSVTQKRGGAHAQSHGTGQTNRSELTKANLKLNHENHTCVRIWGERPYQLDEDNDVVAKEHWRGVVDLSSVEEEKAKVADGTQILSTLKTLNPGQGPGLPTHLPVSLTTLQSEGIKKVATGGTFILFLTSEGNVFSYGIGKHGELGLGPKRLFVRTPLKVSFERTLDPTSVLPRHISPRTERASRGSSVESRRLMNDLTKNRAITRNKETFAEENDLVEVKIRDVACGQEHVLALDTEGRLWVWGNKNFTGLRNLENRVAPTEMPKEMILLKEDDLHSANIISCDVPHPSASIETIGTGPHISAVITNSGRLLLWGNMAGHVMRTPQLIAIFTDPADHVKKMSFGLSMGLLLTGSGSYYQLGVGTFGEILSRNEGDCVLSAQREEERMPEPLCARHSTSVLSMVERHLQYLVPERITNVVNSFGETIPPIADISVGDRHVLLLCTNGSVLAYGDNHRGQCGIGAQKRVVTLPTSLSWTPSSDRAVQISAGAQHSGLVTEQRRLYMWGCTANFRLIYDSSKEFIDYPLLSLTSQNSHFLGRAQSARLGISSEAGLRNSRFTPHSVSLLAAHRVHLLTLGCSYTVVVTGCPSNTERNLFEASTPGEDEASQSSVEVDLKRDVVNPDPLKFYTFSPVSSEGTSAIPDKSSLTPAMTVAATLEP